MGEFIVYVRTKPSKVPSCTSLVVKLMRQCTTLCIKYKVVILLYDAA